MKTRELAFALLLAPFLLVAGTTPSPAPEPGMGRGNDFGDGAPNNSAAGSESYDPAAGGDTGHDTRTRAEKDRDQWGRMQSSRNGRTMNGPYGGPPSAKDKWSGSSKDR